MKPLALGALVAAQLLFAATGRADSLTEDQKAGLVSTDEAGDAWLHDHCSFRGAGDPGVRDPKIPGQVIELIDNGQSPLVKEFRCAEAPPGWKGTWVSAPENAVYCREAAPAPRCVPPLRRTVTPVSAPPPAAPVGPAPAARAPSMIAPPHRPPPPKRPPAVKRRPAKH
ncbi:MAG TPA: hypothetical protein VLT33_19515 [Labilithrix sp.]|nr:hypothetical protein [Labilithrix sp.]